MSRMTDISPFVLTSAATGACALAGSLASAPDSPFYQNLVKPAWNPPNWVFPLAWSSLYTGIAASTGYAWSQLKQEGKEKRISSYVFALTANLVLNASWSFTFFRSHQLGIATVHAGLLALSSGDLVRRTARISKPAGVVLAPYAGWTAFATLLSGAIWRLNSQTRRAGLVAEA